MFVLGHQAGTERWTDCGDTGHPRMRLVQRAVFLGNGNKSLPPRPSAGVRAGHPSRTLYRASGLGVRPCRARRCRGSSVPRQDPSATRRMVTASKPSWSARAIAATTTASTLRPWAGPRREVAAESRQRSSKVRAGSPALLPGEGVGIASHTVRCTSYAVRSTLQNRLRTSGPSRQSGENHADHRFRRFAECRGHRRVERVPHRALRLPGGDGRRWLRIPQTQGRRHDGGLPTTGSGDTAP